MTTTVRWRGSASSATTRRSAGGHHLKLVQYLPAGDEPVVCAAIWREGDHVHLTAPLLPTRHGVRDPGPYMRQFPQGLASIDAFEDTMTWLDATCYAATDPREVESACEASPDCQLRCIPYDGSDTNLLGLSGLIQAADGLIPLPELAMRECLLEVLKQILKCDPELVEAQIEAVLHERDDVAMLELGLDRRVLVSLLHGVPSTDVVRQGMLAHHRMINMRAPWMQCLLVLPDVQLERPMLLSHRVTITNMDADLVRASLVHMAKR